MFLNFNTFVQFIIKKIIFTAKEAVKGMINFDAANEFENRKHTRSSYRYEINCVFPLSLSVSTIVDLGMDNGIFVKILMHLEKKNLLTLFICWCNPGLKNFFF